LKYIIISALFALAIGISYAYAVEVEVPYENFQLTGCSDVDGVYTCQWKKIVEGDEDIPLTPNDETVDEAETIDETIDEPEITMTREERDIQRMIDRIELDLQERPDKVPNADRQLLELLLRTQEVCEFGIEEGQPIQTYQIFAIPEGYFYPEDTDFSKYNMLGKITKLVEACTKWTDYKTKWLGPQYANIYNATVNFVPWSPTATIPYNVTITDEYMNAAISPHDILEEEEDAAEFMCSVLGKQRGLCPEAIGEDVYVPDTTNNPALSKYLQYRDDPENAIGEPRYSVSTNPKCYTLSSFAKQYDLSEQATNDLLQAGGCKA